VETSSLSNALSRQKIKIAGKVCTISEIEISDIGKHGKRKCRIEAKTPEDEKVIIIRPEDYPLDSE